MRAVVLHLLGIMLMLVLLPIALYVTQGAWYEPQYPDGDSDGYLIAVVEAFLFVAPLAVICYAFGAIVARAAGQRASAGSRM